MVEYQESSKWCTVSYYELNKRVGEIFHSNSKSFCIDGFTNTMVNENRFSLGQFSNIQRNSEIEKTRRSIGKGLFNFHITIIYCFLFSINQSQSHTYLRID